MYIISLQIRYL